MTEKVNNYIEPDAQGLLVMCLLAIAAGIISGIGAWGFRMLIGWVHNVLFLGKFSFLYDANVHTEAGPWGMGVILVPVLGGLLVAWLVKNFAPEAKGHGVPEVMDAIHYNHGLIRPRVAIIKSLASAISIGSGAAVGREGPIIQIGSAFGSMLGQVIRMPTRQCIALIAAGSGAGIAATFNAPLGGVVFAIELLLISINSVNVLLISIAVAIATYISRLLLGATPSFHIAALELPDFHQQQIWILLLFPFLGALMGLASAVFIKGLYWAEDCFDALPGNYYTRHMLGMLCVGVMMYLLFRYTGHYYVQGVGYATIVDTLTGVLTDPWFLALLFILKLLATFLSLGSGASGGVFSPSLFMGATAGAAFGHLVTGVIPDLGIGIPAFAIAGMAAAIAGSTGAVLTSIIMITEMTRDYNIVLPLIITVAVAYAVRKALMRESIYTLKLLRRNHVVPEGLESAITQSQNAGDVMQTEFVIIEEGAVLPEGGKVIIMAKDGMIAGVYGIHDKGNATKCYVTGIDTMLPETLRLMGEQDAEIVLVSKQPQSGKTDDIVGVLTVYEIANHTMSIAKLL